MSRNSRGKGQVERKRLETIHRRIEFLETRVRETKEQGRSPSWDIQEAVALRWLLEKADLPIPPPPDSLNDELSLA